jgi:hypothetical protein
VGLIVGRRRGRERLGGNKGSSREIPKYLPHSFANAKKREVSGGETTTHHLSHTHHCHVTTPPITQPTPHTAVVLAVVLMADIREETPTHTQSLSYDDVTWRRGHMPRKSQRGVGVGVGDGRDGLLALSLSLQRFSYVFRICRMYSSVSFIFGKKERRRSKKERLVDFSPK